MLLFLGLTVVYGLTISPQPSLDVASAHFASWHLVQSGSNWIEATGFLDGHPLRETWLTSVGDHLAVARAPGVIAATIPAYFVAQQDEFSNLPGALSAAVMTAAAVTLMFLAISRQLRIKPALIFSVVFGLGTPVWSVAADGMWPHTITVFAIAGMAWAASVNKWWIVGVFGGIALWGRMHVAFVVAILALIEAWRARDWRIVAKVAIPGAVSMAAFVVWTRWMYGEWRLTGGYSTSWVTTVEGRYPSLWTNELGLFFALERGIVVWTPLLLILAPSVWRAWREIPSWSRSLLIGGFAYTVLQGYLNRFSGGDSFWSYRLGLELVASAVPAYALAWHKAGRFARAVSGPLAVLQVAVIGLGAVLNLGGAPAEDAWWANSMAMIVRHEPLVALMLLLAVIPLCYAIPRIVRDPRVTTRHG